MWTPEQKSMVAYMRAAYWNWSQRKLASMITSQARRRAYWSRPTVNQIEATGLGDRSFWSVYGAIRRLDAKRKKQALVEV